MSEVADLYQTLGLSPDADAEAVKKAFRSKAKLYHPDTHPGDKKAEERFKELSQAHEILSDPEKRRRYDAMRQSPFSPGGGGRRRGAPGPAGGFGGGTVSDLFEMFFGRGGGPFGGSGQEEALSQDLESEVWVSFEDAALGRTVTVALGDQAQPLRLNLPAGAEDGLRLRLAGQGHGPRGDLYLTLRVRASERFTRQGFDVSSKARIHLAQALLGGTVTASTLHGDMRVKVAPGTAPGSRLRLAGKGIQSEGRQGDHFVELEVDLPRDLSAEEQEQVRAMAKARGWGNSEALGGVFKGKTQLLTRHAMLHTLILGGALALATSLSSAPAIPSFKDVAKKVRPSVVNLSIVKNVKSPGFPGGRPNDPFLEQFFGRFFDELPREQWLRQRSLGSGVIVNAGEGYVLTNNHVVEGADQITVKLSDKRELEATVVGRDPKTDLAVIKLKKAADLTPAAFGDSDAMEVGDWVLAVGSPFGLEQTVSHGIISAKGRVIGSGPYDDFLQTDAPINPGNSGGPLVNLEGQVIGINTAISTRSGGSEGVGFAIPSNMASKVYQELVSHGKVTRGWLGVSIQDLDSPLAKHFGLPKDPKGVLVADVMPEGPAKKAGFRAGDVIQRFSGREVASVRELQRLVAETPVGRPVPVVVWRDKGLKSLEVKVGDMEELEGKAPSAAAGAKLSLGLQVRALQPEEAAEAKMDQGVIVVAVEAASVAENAGVKEGDILLELEKARITSPQELARIVGRLKAGDAAILRVKRGGRSLYLTLPLPENKD